MIITNFARTRTFEAGETRRLNSGNVQDPDDGLHVVLVSPVRADNPYASGPDGYGWVNVITPSYGLRSVRAVDCGVWVESTA